MVEFANNAHECVKSWVEEVAAAYAYSVDGPNLCCSEWTCRISAMTGTPVNPIVRELVCGFGDCEDEAIRNAYDFLKEYPHG